MHPSINNTISISHVIVFLRSKGPTYGEKSETDAERKLSANAEYFILMLPYDKSLHANRDTVTKATRRLTRKLLRSKYVKLTNNELGHGWKVTFRGYLFMKMELRKAAKHAEKQARRASASRSTFIAGGESFQR